VRTQLEEGTISFKIDRPFTLRDLAGPWSWVANRYYWFVFDELFIDYYVESYKNGNDPTEILVTSIEKIAGNFEIVLEKTNLAFLISDAESGSVLLKVNAAYNALKNLTAWLPLYGKWVQEKGAIDIDTEVKRSAALNIIKQNFIEAGIPEDIAFRMAYERLYRGWPDFFSADGMKLSQHITSSEVTNTGRILTVDKRELQALSPDKDIISKLNGSDE
jgi:hypothetical protein